ncbi:MAG: peptidylprolyl isomerase [Pseudomonadota bacterium]
MHQFLRLPAWGAMAALVAFAAPVFADEADKVIATVNGAEIYQRDFDLAKRMLAGELQRMPENRHRQAILRVLTDSLLMSQLADASGTVETEEYKERLKFTVRRVKRDIYVQQNVTDQVTRADVEERYNELLKARPPQVQVQARHILMKTREEAVAIIKELDGGADFADLAKQKSMGSSAPRGGDLGLVGRGQMQPPFEEAMFALKKGKHSSEPVQTSFGWHVIKKEDEREQAPPPLSQVFDQLKNLLAQERLIKFVEDARAKAKIELKE